MNRPRIAIIGTGIVGSTTAFALSLSSLRPRIMLIDANKDRCIGEWRDLSDAQQGKDHSIFELGTLADARSADIIIICAGRAQRPGQSRIDLLQANYAIMREIVHQVGTVASHTVIIVVTNPVDVMAYVVRELTGLPAERLIGSGTLLDGYRLKRYISAKLSVCPHDITPVIVGEHGDRQVICWSRILVGGLPVALSPAEQAEITEQVVHEAADIINLKGATQYGIAQSVTEICTAIWYDQRHVALVSVYHPNEDVYASWPVLLGIQGVITTLPLALSANEERAYKKSIQFLRDTIAQIPDA